MTIDYSSPYKKFGVSIRTAYSRKRKRGIVLPTKKEVDRLRRKGDKWKG